MIIDAEAKHRIAAALIETRFLIQEAKERTSYAAGQEPTLTELLSKMEALKTGGISDEE